MAIYGMQLLADVLLPWWMLTSGSRMLLPTYSIIPDFRAIQWVTRKQRGPVVLATTVHLSSVTYSDQL